MLGFIRLYKKDPFNSYMWMEISNINGKNMCVWGKNMCVCVCYFAPINSRFYMQHNLDKIVLTVT